ncbi:hypothetical protein LJC56_07320 [Christensenellaceae bacterium OttesenSCG-928-K19]|nr:hypothetical protein [Christensenellaceae bacterium OttesenSCG-928-K19]
MYARQRRQPVIKANPKFYVFIGIIAAAVIAIVYFVTNVNTATVEMGEIRFEEDVAVVVVRDEQVITAENYGRANYLVAEGERVEADTPVADVYKWAYNDKVMNELTEKQKTIEQYQENERQDNDDQQLVEIQNSITAKAAEIRGLINNNSGDLLAAERELQGLMDQKREYLKETVEVDAKLEEYYDEEAQLQERVDGWREVRVAPQAGVVSYYFDGAEQVLNANNLQQITIADVDAILQGTTSPEETVEQTQEPLFRLVNNFKWYLMVRKDEPMIEYANETEYEVGFANYLDRQYSGTVVGHIAEDTDYIYVIEILEDIGELLNTRRTDAKLGTKFEGLKVPSEALRESDGVTGVDVLVDGKKTFVPVIVKVVSEGSAIVEPLDVTSGLTTGSEVAL